MGGMRDEIERKSVIDLLDRLGSEQDEEVLAAARSLHARITDAGLRWQDLLIPGEAAASPDNGEDQEDTETGARVASVISDAGTDDPDTATLIDQLLARENNSAEFREELEEYKADLANGNLADSDHRYIRALYTRLTKADA